MAISTSSITTWNNDGTGTWANIPAGGPASGENNDIFLTSTGSRAKKISSTTKGYGYEVNSSGQDLRNQVICIRWTVTAGVGALATRTAGGVALATQDTSGNISYWDIDGSDTYKGGWKESVIDTAITPSRNSGTAADLEFVQYVGIVWIVTGSVGGGDPNTYIDQIISWPNTGIVITGNSTTLFADLVNTLNSLQGIWQVRSGKFFSKAKIVLQPDASDMSSTDHDFTFENPVYDAGSTIDSTLTEIGFECADIDNVTFTRCNITSADPDETVTTDANREFDIVSATDFDLTTCTIKGFIGTLGVALGGSGQTINKTTFQNNAQITDTGAIIRDCVFRNSTTTAGSYLWDNTNSNVEDTAFDVVSGGHGIEHDIIESVYTGTADDPGSSTTVLYDAGATFTGGAVNVGEYVYNEVDNCFAKILSIDDANTLTHEALAEGTVNDWTNGDAYSISPFQTYTNLTFSGAGTHINNTATGSDGLFISKSGTSNPSTATGNVGFIGSVTVTITVKDVGGNLLSDVQTAVYLISDRTEIMNEDTVVGVASASYTGATPADVEVRCRKASFGDTKYKNFSSVQTIGTSGLNFAVTMIVDTNNNATT